MATSNINKDVNFRFRSTSDIPTINKQLEELLSLIKGQEIAVRAANVQYAAQTMAIKELSATNTTAQAAILASQQKALEAQKKTTEATNEQTKAMQTASAQQIAATGQVKNSVDSVGASFRSLATLVGVGFSIQQVKSFGQEVIDAKSKIDFFKIGLDNIIGSERAVASVYSDLVKIAKTTPFSIEDLSKTTLALSAMGVETNRLIPTIQALGDVSALAGSDKLPRIAKAYTDVMNKGILMKQEINQFSENSIPIYNMLALSMEKTRDEVVKLAEDHKISFADVEKAFKKATEEGGKYYNMAITQSQTLGGRMKNLSDTIQFAKAALGDYYENGLSRMIDGFENLVEAIGGSQSAIERSITWVKAGAAAIITFEVATKGAAAATAIWNGAKTAWNLGQAAMITLLGSSTAATVGFTEAQIAAATAMKLTPWGVVATLVGVATTAYFAFEAATMEVVNSLGEEEIKIKNQQALFNSQVKSVMALTEGTKERTSAMEGLIRKYPEYFSGLSTETTSNAVLNQILGRVNQSYEDRIGLARQAYTIGKLEEQRTKYLQEEYELMERIKKRSPELYAQVGGDSQKLMAAIQKGGVAMLHDLDKQGGLLRNMWDNAVNGTIINSVATVSSNLKKIDKEILSASERRENITRKEVQSALDAENVRWMNITNQLKRGTKQYELEQAEHEKRVRQISGETTEYVFKQEDEKAKKKKAAQKSSLELELENNLKELQAAEKTYMNKMAILDAEEKLEVERAKRTITNKTDLNKRLESIEIQFIAKKAELMRKEIDGSIDYDMKELKAAENRVTKIIALKQKEADAVEDLTLFIAELQKKQDEKRVKDYEKSVDVLLDIAQKAAHDSIAIGADEAAANKKLWESREMAVNKYWIKVKQTEIDELQASIQRQIEYNEKMMKLYGGDSAEYTDGLGILVGLQNSLKKADNDMSKFKEKSSKDTKSWLAAIVQAIGEVYQMIVGMQIEALEQIVSSYSEAAQIWYDLADANKAAMDDIIKDTSLTYEELEVKLQNTINNQQLIMSQGHALEMLRMKNQQYLDDMKSDAEAASKGIGTVTSLLNGDIGSAFANLIGFAKEWLTSTKRTAYEHQAEVYKQQANLIQANMDRINMELDAETALYNKKMELLDADLLEFKRVQNEKMDALRAAQAEEMAIMSQLSADKQLRLLEDQAFRNTLLDQGEAREVRDLEAARARLLQEAAEKNASAEEVANINIAFDELVKQKHNEYATARGDKNKEVSLAIQEQKAQEKDAIIASDKLIKDESNKSQSEIEEKAAETSLNKQIAQEAYVKYVKEANRQLFEAEKQMAVANIRVEIAKLKSKSHFLGIGKGKTDDAIRDLESLINEINGTWNPYSDTGAPTPTRPGRQSSGYDPDEEEGPREETPREPTTQGPRGKPRGGYHGFEYLKPQAGDPFTRDSIPMMLEHQERVITKEPNIRLLNKAGFVSNEDLINGYIEYYDLKKSNPKLFNNKSIDYKNLNVLSSLPGLMSMDFTKLQTIGAPVMNLDNSDVVRAINSLGNKPTVNVAVYPHKTKVEEVKGNNKKIYENVYSKSL